MQEKGPNVVTLRDGVYLNYKPTDKEIGRHLSLSSGPLSETLVRSFSDNRDRVKLSLRRVPDQVSADLIPDRTSLSLLYLYSQYDSFLTSKVLESVNNPSDFVFWADFKYGFDIVLGTLSVAQSPNTREETMIKSLSRDAEIWPQAKWEQPQIRKEAKVEADYWAEELAKDPSGFGLIDRVLDDLKQRIEVEGLPKKVTYEIPEYVTAGADLSVRLYKLCYPLTEVILE